MIMTNDIYNDVVIEFTAPGLRDDEFYDDAMDIAVAALEDGARMVALGPVASADTGRRVIRVRCTVGGTSPLLDQKVASLVEMVRDALIRLDARDVRRTKLEISEETVAAC